MNNKSTLNIDSVFRFFFVVMFIFLLGCLSFWRIGIEYASNILLFLAIVILVHNKYLVSSLLAHPLVLILSCFLIVATASLIANNLSVLEVDYIFFWFQSIVIGFICAHVLRDKLLLCLGAAPLIAVLTFIFAAIYDCSNSTFDIFNDGRLTLFSGHPNRLAVLYSMHIIICLSLIFYTKNKLIRTTSYILLLLLIPLLLMTTSRSPLLGLAITGPLFLFLHLRSNLRLIKMYIPVFFIFILLIITFTCFNPNSRLWTAIQNPLQDPTFKSRLVIWHVAWEALKENPFLGIGFDNFKPYYTNMLTLKEAELKRSFPVVESLRHRQAHNFFLHYLAETGIIGALLISIFWFYVIFNGFRYGNPGVLISICFLQLLIGWQLDMGLKGRDHSSIAFILVGALIFLMNYNKTDHASSPGVHPNSC